MARAEQWLALLLRIEAVVLMCALPAVFMPTSWMEAVHQTLGLGPLPRAPLVEYLTRSLSLLYSAVGPLYLLLASDLRRYLPVVKLLAWIKAGFGIALVLLDWWIVLPTLWFLLEGPVVVGLAGLGMVLIARIEKDLMIVAASNPVLEVKRDEVNPAGRVS